MQKRLLLLAVALMLLGFLLARQAIQAARAEEAVVVATKPIAPYTIIPPDAVAVKKIPKAAALDAFRDPAEVVGRASIGNLLPDEPVRPGHVTDVRYARLSGSLPPGRVAVALPSSLELTVSDSVRPGDRIDLYAVREGGVDLVLPAALVRAGGGKAEEDNPQAGGGGGVILEIDETAVPAYLNAIAGGGRFLAVLRPIAEEKGPEINPAGPEPETFEKPVPPGEGQQATPTGPQTPEGEQEVRP
ncbi:Flp pilus assembly protein CpaB [Hydrogenibacillus schlegelii]|nr:Flp pilus assembly protein CpaB [Hydrogenibacillus schlegelii]